MGTATMGRKKSEAGPKPVGVNIKGSEEWAAWLKRAADHCSLSLSAFIDQAARDYAKRRKFTEEGPKR
jgi:uncharacterized protein (DUF1778 family)